MLQLLRTNRDIRILFVAQIISYLGDWFAFVALAGLVQDATGSRLLVSLVLVAFSLPSFLFSPLGGPCADRFDRRTVLIVVSLAQAAAACGLLIADRGQIWAVFVFQGAISAGAAFVKPAVEAAIPNLARTPFELRTANALLGSAWGVMLALGAAIGGVFSELFGRSASFVANAISFVVAAGLFASVRTKMQEHDVSGAVARMPLRPIADMAEAVRFARRDPVVLALMASKATFAIGAGVVSQLAVLANDVFKAGDGGRGLLIGARGVGAGLGPVMAARFTRGDLRRILLVCGTAGCGFSLLYLGAAWAPSLWLSAAAVAVAHLGGGAQWTLTTFGLQMRAPDSIRGRVLAGDFAIVTLVLSITSFAAGAVSEAIGVRAAISIFAGLAGVAGGVYLFVTRSLRHVDYVSRS
jgi:MFS family permease